VYRATMRHTKGCFAGDTRLHTVECRPSLPCLAAR
jgi:hypothetical protein